MARLGKVFIYSSLKVSGCGCGLPLCRLEFMGLNMTQFGGMGVSSYQACQMPLSSGRLTQVLPTPHISVARALPPSILSHTWKYQKKFSLDPNSQQQPNTMLPSPLSNSPRADPHHRIPYGSPVRVQPWGPSDMQNIHKQREPCCKMSISDMQQPET